MTQQEFAQFVDVTLVKNTNTIAEIDEMVDYVGRYPFACVFTLQCYMEYVLEKLKSNTSTNVGGIIGFPSGGEFTKIKLAETSLNMELGADELDMVVNIGWLLSGKYDLALDEIRQIREIAAGKPLKCIIEMSCLDDYTARKACEIVARSGADYVKTGTGWFGPATIGQVRLIKETVGSDVLIKAAGGIRDLEAVKAFRDEGVHRLGIGLSSAMEIMKELS
jgi:deoxyribose-phosphate aldolase